MGRKLTDKQLNVLTTVLKFRYVTTENLAATRSTTHNTAYNALKILTKEGYLGELYDKKYHLHHKAARYYLTEQAIGYLRNTADIEQPAAIWNTRKKDGHRSVEFVDQHVAIHAAYNSLQAWFGSTATIQTALELYGTDGMIKPLPGLFASPVSGKPFFVELTDGLPLFLAKKQIRRYIQHYTDGDWEWSDYPDVFLVRRHSAADRTSLRRYAETRMDEAYLDETDFIFHVVSRVDDRGIQ